MAFRSCLLRLGVFKLVANTSLVDVGDICTDDLIHPTMRAGKSEIQQSRQFLLGKSTGQDKRKAKGKTQFLNA